MAIQKVGLDFFPLKVDFDQDDKVSLLIAKHGVYGYAVIIKMYSKIYADKGYYYEWNEDTQLLFSSKLGIEHNKVLEIIHDAVKWKIFNEDKFKKYGILTSGRIQKNYLDITSRRLRVEIIKEYLVNGVNVNIINKNVNIIDLNVNIMTDNVTQTKVEREECCLKEVKEVKEVKEGSKTHIPFEEIIKFYNSVCVDLAKVQILTDKRKNSIRLRWNKYADKNNKKGEFIGMKLFEELFQRVNDNDFLSGRVEDKKGKKPWRADFDWLLEEQNLVKVLEGKYD